MRRPLLVGNWKMNTSYAEARELATEIRRRSAASPVEVVLCPPFVWLDTVRRAVEGTDIRVGAQDVYWEDRGAYTGEVSPRQLKDLCDYVIVGHSERRALFGETDEVVARKAAAALAAGLTPIIAVGEDAAAFEAGRTEEVVRTQLAGSLPPSPRGAVVVAYEPLWAVGTGRPATPENAQAVAQVAREALNAAGVDADATPVLYGGSVTPENFAEFAVQPDLDGALVGGASLNAERFARLVDILAAAAY